MDDKPCEIVADEKGYLAVKIIRDEPPVEETVEVIDKSKKKKKKE